MISPRETVGRRGLQDRDWIYAKTITKAELAAACEGGAWQKVDAGSLGVLDDYATYLVREQLLVKSLRPAVAWVSTAYHPGQKHPEGRAFDVVLPREVLVTAWWSALRFHRWGGIGILPFQVPDPALHLDTRWAGDGEQGHGFRVAWYQDQDGQRHHMNTEQDLRNLAQSLA